MSWISINFITILIYSELRGADLDPYRWEYGKSWLDRRLEQYKIDMTIRIISRMIKNTPMTTAAISPSVRLYHSVKQRKFLNFIYEYFSVWLLRVLISNIILFTLQVRAQTHEKLESKRDIYIIYDSREIVFLEHVI